MQHLLRNISGGLAVLALVATKAAREFLQPKYAIPMRYATNPFLVGTPQQYIEALGGYPVKVLTINPGDKLRF